MIDIHSHILTDVDDGAQTLVQTIATLNTVVDAGVKTILATPQMLEFPSAGT